MTFDKAAMEFTYSMTIKVYQKISWILILSRRRRMNLNMCNREYLLHVSPYPLSLSDVILDVSQEYP